MNRFYIIVPAILLAIFSGLYWQHNQAAAAFAKNQAALVSDAKAAEEAKKAVAERQAREDAAKREAARLAAEQKKEDERRAKWEADSARIADDTALYARQAAAALQQKADLEKQLADIRAANEKFSHDNFDLARDIELARIAKRNAELEIQRMTEMVARKAGDTSLVRSAP